MSVKLCEVRTVLTQPMDSEGEPFRDQMLTIKVIDTGQGPYMVLETERWTLNLEEVQGFLETLKKMLTIQEGLK